MKITLGERTIDHVRIYFEKTQNDTIRRMLPSDVTCIEQAIANFEQSLLPEATAEPSAATDNTSGTSGATASTHKKHQMPCSVTVSLSRSFGIVGLPVKRYPYF